MKYLTVFTQEIQKKLYVINGIISKNFFMINYHVPGSTL